MDNVIAFLRAWWEWLWHARALGFTFGRCPHCERYTAITPGEGLCESCWLDTK